MASKTQNSDSEYNPSVSVFRHGVLRWFILFFVISGGWFTLGVLVGRGMSPVRFDVNQIQADLVRLRQQHLDKELKRFLAADGKNGKISLVFYDKLKDLKAAEPIPIEKFEPPAKKHSAKITSKMEIQERIQAPPVRSLAPQSETPKADQPPANPKHIYTIQVASVRNLDAANQMVKKLQNQNYPAYSVMTHVASKGIWHRVRIGRFKSKSKANGMIQRLHQHNYNTMLLQTD